MLGISWDARSLHGEADRVGGAADEELVIAGIEHVLLHVCTPGAHGRCGNVDVDVLGLPGGNVDARESNESEPGFVGIRLDVTEINLSDFITVALADVFDGEGKFDGAVGG